MIRPSDRVFIDTGAWIALAEVQDPLHARARANWELLSRAGVRLFTSVPVVIETFTFLDRRGSREIALRWKARLSAIKRLQILGCSAEDFENAWRFLDVKELHKLSLVGATSFALMRRHKIRVAFAFDTHFAVAGFRYTG